MTAIVIRDLSWSLPDGRPLFSHLDLTFDAHRTGLIGRNGMGKSTLLNLIARDLPLQTGAITVKGTVGVLRQSHAPDSTVADLFGVTEGIAILQRAEAGEATADDLTRADWTLEDRLNEALARMALDATPGTLLGKLSGGQQTRAALAALTFNAPDVLLLDEPTNHLDRQGRQAVLDALGEWRKGAVVVSHDRELLDTMDAIVELTSLGAMSFGGNWSHYRDRKAEALAAAHHDLMDAESRAAEVARTAQTSAERKARKDSAGRRKAARGDAPKILLGMMKNRSENTSGGNARLAERLRAEADSAITAARQRIEVLEPFAVSLPPTGLPSGRTILKLAGVTAGYLPDRPVVLDLDLHVTGPERIAITGPNGSGKTTLLSLITGRLGAQHGIVQVTDRMALLDQQVSLLDPAFTIRDNFRRLHPASDENTCRAALARFMFRADAALQTVGTLSGGQRLRAGLACVLGAAPPWLLCLDEPTNHLDISSLEAVEAGLKAYDGGLIVVSHDEAFLDAVGITRRVDLG
jgi:ATPase subunit of ABC transporter with duplicated ATPase domains